MCTPRLPGELWTLVFGYLSFSDRLRLRVTCKYFRDHVDNALWRGRTVELKRSSDEYEEDFWRLLRRWRVTSALLSSPHSWTHIAQELPGLTTLTINFKDFAYLQVQDLRSFTNLEHLNITHHTTVPLEKLSLFLPQRLKHLRLCEKFDIDIYSFPVHIAPDSPFKLLKSFTFHCFFNTHPANVLHFFISSLPQLQHLSLSIYTDTSYEDHMPELPPLHSCSLSSLELVKCQPRMLPVDFTKMLRTLPSLRSLAIWCLYCPHVLFNESDDHSCKLSSWLRYMPALTSLVIKGAGGCGFIRSIPSSVTHLTLMHKQINSEDMTALSKQLPNLLHLHLEPRAFLGSDTALIPQHFPRLRTLRIRWKSRFPKDLSTMEPFYFERVPEDALLSLASLKELEVLETQDVEPLPAPLVSKLRALTNNRVRICKKPEEDLLRSCNCA